MQSTQERKKGGFARALLPPFNADLKKYDELYQQFSREGYTRELCEAYADAFVNNRKKPAAEDLVQLVSLYDRVHEFSSAEFYLEMLSERKLSGDDKFGYCIEALKVKSKLGHWRDAEDFRTENINFMQNHSEKVDQSKKAKMYIALALADCAAKNYEQAGKLLTAFGFKPEKRSDTTLLEMMITAVYICAKSGDPDSLAVAVANAEAAKKITEFEFPWCKDYYEQCIQEASEGVL